MQQRILLIGKLYLRYDMLKQKLFNQAFLGAAFGTLVEYYDVVLFIIFLPIFSPVLFPGASTYQTLVMGYFILFISMLTRPLGAVVFGYLGDTYGRRTALLSSMYGIAIATFMIGLIPSYAVIGVWSIVMITVIKAVQVFCFGGEYNGAGIYVVEHAQNKQELLTGSLLTAIAVTGSVLACLIGVILTLPAMPSWSWRLAFIFGGIIGIAGIAYRRNLLESPHFQGADTYHHGLRYLIKHYPIELLSGVFLGGLTTAPITTILVFINPILMQKGYMTSHQLMWLHMFLMIMAILFLVLVGIVADKKSPIQVMLTGCWFLVVLAYPLLKLVDGGTWLMIITAFLLLIMGNEMILAPTNAYLKNIFIMQVRYRGSSLSFCLGMAVFGGMTPLVEHYLYQMTGKFSAISIWLIFMSLGAIVSLSWVSRRQQEPIGMVTKCEV